MPKLWNDTIEAHRREVHEAILNKTALLVAKHGLRGVTMSQVAAETGIGRATLYKYFPDVEGILRAWHEQHINAHLEQLVATGTQAGNPAQRLAAVLEAYGMITREQQTTELGILLHQGEHVARAQERLRKFIKELIADGIASGDFRNDSSADELAWYCLHALTAARELASKAAVRRLVAVITSGLRA
ncbi:MAG TPA: TetR/AcrR family transcriptional regulator [Polyangiaceae bacterium]|nr:TetR/AcrR family transcriptional regulator [Polyangiaceae bacterium]